MYGNLKTLRENLGMTQKEFADSLGVRPTTYNGYETGARDPKSDFWVAAATKFNVTIDYLMGHSSDPTKTGEEKTPPSPAEPDQRENGRAAVDGPMTVDNLTEMLQAAGYIRPGSDLSENDLHFLVGIHEIVLAWFRKGREGEGILK